MASENFYDVTRLVAFNPCTAANGHGSCISVMCIEGCGHLVGECDHHIVGVARPCMDGMLTYGKLTYWWM